MIKKERGRNQGRKKELVLTVIPIEFVMYTYHQIDKTFETTLQYFNVIIIQVVAILINFSAGVLLR